LERKKIRCRSARGAIPIKYRVPRFRDLVAAPVIAERARRWSVGELRGSRRNISWYGCLSPDAIEASNVDVQLNTPRSVRVLNRRIGEGLNNHLHRILQRGMCVIRGCKKIEFEKQILTARIGTHRRQVHVDDAVRLSVIPVSFPAIQ